MLDDVRGVLEVLRGRVKLAVISDTGVTLGRDLKKVLGADGLAGIFDCFTFSDETGLCKPEYEQFRATLERLGVPAEAAVHVGDLEASDVAGARGVGMRTIRMLWPHHNSATAADAAVTRLRDILPILRKWGLPAAM
jgi:putative hydrolase of the HAD superfamily